MAETIFYSNHTSNMPSLHPTVFFNYNHWGKRISTVVYSIIYTLGFIGNILALITFSSRRMRRISSSVFLLILAFSDTIALVTSLWFFIADAFAIQLQNYSALACRFRTFFAYVFMDLSSWCIAGLAFDRYLRTKLPLGSKTLCTPRNTLIMILIFFLLLCGINGHYFSPGIGQERSGNRTTAHCLENREQYPTYFYFLKIIWPKIDMIIFCFLPACIMILCNVNIIHLLRRQRRCLEHNTNDRPDLHNNLLQTPSSTVLVKNSASTHRKAIEIQMSLMMAACVIVFLCTTVPVTIYLIFLEQVTIKKTASAHTNAYYMFIFRMLRALMYIHFGSNFYLYCLTSRIFRSEFVQTITCRRFTLNSHHEPYESVAPPKTTNTSNPT